MHPYFYTIQHNMKKILQPLKVLLVVFSIFLGTTAFGQVSNYTFSQSTGTYTPITGGTVVRSGSALDTGGALVTLPTAFTFNGASVTQVYVKDDGYLALGVTSFSSTAPITSTVTATGIIAALACDLMDANAAGAVPEIRWEQVGNEIIFQWNDIARYIGSTSVEIFDFQIRLNTSTGQINIIYSNFGTTNTTTTYTPQVGLRGASNSDYNARRLTTTVPDATPSWDDTVAATSNAHTVRFTATSPAAFPATGLTYSWSPLLLSPCATPSAAPTALVFGTTTTTTIAGSFTAASPAPSKYLVVRSTSATAPTPSNGTVYTVGATTFGAGTNVRSVSNATTFSDTGLTAGTQYYYYIFSYNDLCTGEPFYRGTPLSGSHSTVCSTGTALGSNTITASSANITWTGSGNYIVEYGATGFTPGNGATAGSGGTVASSSATSPYGLSGLSASTTYQVYVRQACPAGGYSANSSVHSFTTTCAAITTFPSTEPFATYLPNCWREGDAGDLTTGPSSFGAAVSDWGVDGFLNVGITGAAKMNIDTATGSEWLISPFYTFPASGYRVKYNVGATNFAATTAVTNWEADDFVELLVSTSNSNWTVLKTYNSANVPSNLGQIDIVDLSAYSGQTVQFAFRAFEGAANGAADIDFFLDNFIIEAIPTDAVDYANIQFPGVSSTTSGTSVDIFGQAYEPFVTEAAGAGSGLVVWYSKNTTDVDPNSVAWTGTWTLATFNTDVGNNDEWKGTITPIPGQADTYYSFRYQLNGGPMRYGGYSGTGGGFWDGTNNKNGKLSVNYEVYTDAISPNNTVNNTINIYLKDFDGNSNFFTSGETSIWMYAGVRTSTNNFQYISTTNPVQDLNITATLVEFVRTTTNPNVYKATLKFADYFCIPSGTTVTGIDLLFRNQYWNASCGTVSAPDNCNNKTTDLFLDLGDAVVVVNPPTIGTATLITQTTATIDWSAPGSGAVKGYDYYYSTSNTAPIAATMPSGSTAAETITADLTSLLSGTTYYFWARTKSCDGASVWSGTGTFTTLCNVTPITITEGFNAATAMPSCWSSQVVAVQTGTKLSFVPSGLYPTTSPYFGANMVKYDSFSNTNGTSGSEERLVSLPMSSIGSTSVDVEFYFNRENGYSTKPLEGVQVQYSLDGTSWTNAGSFIPRYSSTVTGWEKQTITIPAALAGQSKFFVGFKFHSEYGNNMYLDEVTVKPTPRPITINSSATLPICSGNSTTLTATSAAGYTYSWTPATGLNTTTGASVFATPLTTTTYTVTGVFGTETTTKSITVTVNPAPTALTLTETAVSPGGTTSCDLDYVTLNAVGGVADVNILTENFEGTAPGWTTENYSDGGPTANADWVIANSPYTSSSPSINISSRFAISNSDIQGSAGNYTLTYLNSPVIDTRGYSSLKIDFDQFFKAGFSGFDEGRILVSTDNVNFTSVASYINTLGSATSFANSTVDLSSYINQATLYITFEYYAEYDYYWALDNIKVSGERPTVIWTPATGLFTDTNLTIRYVAGTYSSTLYAAPDTETTYTATATATLGGCSVSAMTTPILRAKKDFTGLDAINPTLWSSVDNWSTQTLPTSDKCVNIPTGKTAVVDINNAAAKNVTIAQTGQLTVKTGQALTVKEEINIPLNNAANTNLIVESEANLLQVDNVATNNNTGTAKVNRYVADMDNVLNGPTAQMDYVYWGSPVTGQGLQQFSPGTPANRIFQYRESNDRFYAVPLATEPNFLPAKGYAIRAEVSAQFPELPTGYEQTYVFNGVPNNGDYSVPIVRSPNGGTPTVPIEHGYNLVGNPYPSNIVFNRLFAGNSTKIKQLAYFWTNNNFIRSQQGNDYVDTNYAIYNGTGGSAASGTGNTTEPDGNIKVGQGFIIQKLTTGSASLDFKNSYGVGQELRTSAAGTFYNKNEMPKDRFWLQLISQNDVRHTQLIGYVEGATNDFDVNYDAEALSMGSDLFYSKINDKELVIQGKSLFSVDDKVLLGANYYFNGNYTIGLKNAEGIFADGQVIYLKDNVLQTYTNLQEGTYTFTATKGISDGRFEIVYKTDAVLVTDDTTKNGLNIYRDADDFVVKSSMKEIKKVEVFEASGRLILTVDGNSKEVRIASQSLVNGIYVVKAILKDDSIVTTKIRK